MHTNDRGRERLWVCTLLPGTVGRGCSPHCRALWAHLPGFVEPHSRCAGWSLEDGEATGQPLPPRPGGGRGPSDAACAHPPAACPCASG